MTTTIAPDTTAALQVLRVETRRWEASKARAAAELQQKRYVAAIRAAHEAGLSLQDIADELGVTKQRIYQLLTD